MHEAAYDTLGLDARYVSLEPAPEDIRSAIEGAAALGIAGLNVTIPFKEAVLDEVNPTDRAAQIGAVNTVDFSTDPPGGYNTDVDGVRRSFAHHDVPVAGTEAVIVGAGGAGRAVAYALVEAGASVAIANRTTAKAETLAAELDAPTAHSLASLEDLLADAEILVNATSVGMQSDETVVDRGALHPDLTVMDAVYHPLETRLLRDANAVGATTIDGAWMLLYQGIEAFERWTARSAPVEAMNTALRSRLEG